MKYSKRHIILIVGIGLLVTLCTGTAVAQESSQREGNGGNPIGMGVAYTDMGDFDADYGLQVRKTMGKWVLTGAWNNVDATVTGRTRTHRDVDGNLWQLDLGYPLIGGGYTGAKWAAGVGAGLRSIDADWTTGAVTESGSEMGFGGHLWVRRNFGHLFGEARYYIGSELGEYDSDGLQLTFGASLAFGRPPAKKVPPEKKPEVEKAPEEEAPEQVEEAPEEEAPEAEEAPEPEVEKEKEEEPEWPEGWTGEKKKGPEEKKPPKKEKAPEPEKEPEEEEPQWPDTWVL